MKLLRDNTKISYDALQLDFLSTQLLYQKEVISQRMTLHMESKISLTSFMDMKDRKHWAGVVGKIQESMKALRDASKKYQDELIDQRARGDNEKIGQKKMRLHVFF